MVSREYFKSFRKQDYDWRGKEIKLIIEKLEFEADGIREILQVVSRARADDEVCGICEEALGRFSAVRKHFERMQKVIPAGFYHRYRYKVRYVMERLICLLSYIKFLKNADFMTVDKVAEFLGVLYGEKDTLFDLETYLIGLLQMADELARLCMVDIINGRFDRPSTIMLFMKNLNEGFLLLNFKNDFLRRKYDGLKYRIKEVEIINDDILMHGLKKDSVETPLNVQKDEMVIS